MRPNTQFFTGAHMFRTELFRFELYVPSFLFVACPINETRFQIIDFELKQLTSITLTIRMLIIQSFPLQFFSLYFNSNYCHCLHIQIRHSFTYKSFSFALLTYSRTLGSGRKNSCFKAEVHQ